MTADEIKACGADAVVIVTGSVTSMPPIPGIDKAITALDAINHPEKLGDTIIVAGGGLVGCEIAYDETLKGKKATVIEALPDIMAAGGAANILKAVAEGYAAGNSI